MTRSEKQRILFICTVNRMRSAAAHEIHKDAPMLSAGTMTRFLSALAAIVLLAGCWSNPLGLYDEGTCPTFTERPADSLLVGIYELDTARSLPVEATALRLESSGRVFCERFPYHRIGSFELDTAITLNGTWQTVEQQGHWNEVELHDTSIGRWTMHLCSSKGNTMLRLNAGDPDAGRGALFRRTAR